MLLPPENGLNHTRSGDFYCIHLAHSPIFASMAPCPSQKSVASFFTIMTTYKKCLNRISAVHTFMEKTSIYRNSSRRNANRQPATAEWVSGTDNLGNKYQTYPLQLVYCAMSGVAWSPVREPVYYFAKNDYGSFNDQIQGNPSQCHQRPPETWIYQIQSVQLLREKRLTRYKIGRATYLQDRQGPQGAPVWVAK